MLWSIVFSICTPFEVLSMGWLRILTFVIVFWTFCRVITLTGLLIFWVLEPSEIDIYGKFTELVDVVIEFWVFLTPPLLFTTLIF